MKFRVYTLLERTPFLIILFKEVDVIWILLVKLQAFRP